MKLKTLNKRRALGQGRLQLKASSYPKDINRKMLEFSSNNPYLMQRSKELGKKYYGLKG